MTEAAIQFHLYECIPNHVAAGLRRLGHDCTTTYEADLRGSNDRTQIDHCRNTNRVLVTRDSDFLRMADLGVEHTGIVYWTEKHGISQLIRDLDTICFQSNLKQTRNTVMYC